LHDQTLHFSLRRILPALAGTLLTALASVGGCECEKSTSEEVTLDDEARIVTQSDPDAARPETYFPSRLRTDDESLNQFIDHALKVSHEGAYDDFRVLFGTAYNPPSYDDFAKVWHGIREIRIVSIHPFRRNPRDPQTYLVHVEVTLRAPDSRDRTRRDTVVEIFREAGEWRLGAPPKEAIARVLAIDSQPAGVAATSRPG
jgi:hypothetical protein